MAVITDVNFQDFAQVKKRYEFILPQLREMCADIHTNEFAADMLVTGHKELKEIWPGDEGNIT